MKDYKHRCKELETNLDMSRLASENSSFFGNRGASDFGIKELKIEFTKEQKKLQNQLASAKEELSKTKK